MEEGFVQITLETPGMTVIFDAPNRTLEEVEEARKQAALTLSDNMSRAREEAERALLNHYHRKGGDLLEYVVGKLCDERSTASLEKALFLQRMATQIDSGQCALKRLDYEVTWRRQQKMEGVLSTWCQTRTEFTTIEAMVALGMPEEDQDQSKARDIAKILHRLGWESVVKDRRRFWVQASNVSSTTSPS